MASSTPHTILLESSSERRFIKEAAAAAAITPGFLLERTSANAVQAHSNAGRDVAPVMFAVENPYSQNNTEPSIDTDWASGSQVRFIIAQPGDVVYAWLAAGENVAIGAKLESDGAGALQAHTAQAGTATTIYTRAIVAEAAEAVNNSAGTVAARIKARVA